MAAFLLPSIGFGLSNLFLLSPKGRTYISSRITARIQLDTSVQGTTWSPWNGITVYGVRVEQPRELRGEISKPLISIQSVHLDPVWKQVLRKRLDLKGIDLVKPNITLPIELLSMIPTSQPDTELAMDTPPDLAMNQPSPQQTTPSTTPPAVVPAPTEPQPTPPQPPTIETPAPPEITAPTRFIRLTDARLRIVTTMSKSPLYEVLGLTGSIPFAGKKTQTSLVTGAISTLGNKIAEDMKIPLDWNAPALTSNPNNGKVFGIDTTTGIQLALTQGLPLRIIASIPEQKDKEVSIGQSTGMKLGAVAGQGIFQGFLAYPASWQGQALVRSMSIDGKHLGNETHFDSGHALFVFRNGALSCVDARLNGEDISILSNATLLSDGRGAAVMRIVAAPETLGAISSFTDPTGSPPYFTPLHTPQRAALDLQIFGRLGEFHYKPNPKAPPILVR
ncbi:MAG: hypothetical protein NWR51_07560 [Akkermansiaceae bacterium]|nr:hypothetical protein [Akkermansiaceae bacterium]MDP4995456.1 hypothetical protein [Akkermansiaceae bacterium]